MKDCEWRMPGNVGWGAETVYAPSSYVERADLVRGEQNYARKQNVTGRIEELFDDTAGSCAVGWCA